MASVNPSAMVAESLSTHSKAVYQAFAEVEAQSRIEVARMVVDVREAKTDRDKATRELHAVQLEAQNWKQEIVTTKAVIAHQAETIAQLRREVTQWKDQSRNWQEHFLRVEQERCAQSSRIDELVVEMQYPNQRTGSTALHTPKTMKYTDGVNSAPSSSSKRLSVTTSPTQPPVPPSPSTLDSSVTTPSTQTGGTNTQRRNKRAKTQNERERDVPSMQANNDQEEGSSTGAKRPRKNHTNTNANASTSSTSTQGPTTVAAQQKPDAPATVRSSTVIRRVQAVIHVKREESYSEEEDPRHEASGAASASTLQNASSSTTVKKKEESVEYQRYLRTPRRKIVEDEQYEDEDEDIDLGSDPLSGAAGRHQQRNQRSRFRQRSRINYQEEDDDDNEEEDEDDELMMGAEENHDEVYGTQPIEAHASQQSKKHSKAGRPAKKRKVTAR
ncbi:hypothetical protein CVT25_006199 [Psilocybe cyanescens]|uniref:Uncharacterized protein n=1 Tax=Psilocybe cyanescens TaxID=93625 RepID=A0A409X9W0_PSICY|nr:hypothetical protein CVT25_006199 [Psilocybe cyanescens]